MSDLYRVKAHDVIEAKQWDGSEHSAILIAAWIQQKVGLGRKVHWEFLAGGLSIEGGANVFMLEGDWILRYANGVFSLRDDIEFRAVYEKHDVV